MVRRFRDSISGIAAVEFAYIFPVFMLMISGTLEVSQGVVAHKRFQKAAAMIGDLISREEQIGAANGEAATAFAGILTSAQQVMDPISSSTLRFKVYSILRATAANSTQTRAVWSWDSYTGAISKVCTAKAMPADGMLAPGTAAIVVEAEFEHSPIVANMVPGFMSMMSWSDVITHSPRKNNCVGIDGKSCAESCPNF
ncbi:MAG: TadE/TadG family type IV pilus assembly protein [Hyphomicrobium sp.]